MHQTHATQLWKHRVSQCWSASCMLLMHRRAPVRYLYCSCSGYGPDGFGSGLMHCYRSSDLDPDPSCVVGMWEPKIIKFAISCMLCVWIEPKLGCHISMGYVGTCWKIVFMKRRDKLWVNKVMRWIDGLFFVRDSRLLILCYTIKNVRETKMHYYRDKKYWKKEEFHSMYVK